MLKKFLFGIGKGILNTFKGRNIFWHLLAIAITYIFVVSGFDWWYFSATRGNTANLLGMSAGMLGFFVPVFLPLGLFIVGAVKKNDKLKMLAVNTFQAVAAAFLITVFYKIFTGRVQPEYMAMVAGNDVSRGFNFGFWRHGIFWGWPSSHTAVAFSMSFFLALRLRHKKWLGIFAIIFAIFIGTGAGLSFHWLSDVVAGAIIGSLVGYVVYKNSLKS